MGRFFDEIGQSGPKDIYEKVAVSQDAELAMEFLVRECQSKDRMIHLLAQIIHHEVGEAWWQQYADQLGQIPSVNLNHYSVEEAGPQ